MSEERKRVFCCWIMSFVVVVTGFVIVNTTRLAHEDSQTALIEAARKGYTGVVGLLLRHPGIDTSMATDVRAIVLVCARVCVDKRVLVYAHVYQHVEVRALASYSRVSP